ncbi:MAG: hypothetical protein WD942_08160 [Dehalococcoidia bacterium]
MLQITGFLSQRDVIELAEFLEASPALAEVTLACLADSDAWLTVRASSPDTVVTVISRWVEHELDIVVNQNFVEARMATGALPTSTSTSTSAERVSDGPASVGSGASAAFVGGEVPAQVAQAPSDERPMAASEDEAVLPPRPRFRVFRPAPAAPREPDFVSDRFEDEPRFARPNPPAEGNDEGDLPEAAQYYILATQPFRSFSTVNAYHQVIREFEGVQSTHVQRFERGTLYLAITYRSRVPLRQRLERMDGYSIEVLNETNSRIEVALRAAPDAARNVRTR